MAHTEPVLELKNKTDKEIARVLSENRLSLTVDEAKKVVKLLGRNPTITEATVWNIQGSEHCSYKSSRRHLKMLPTDGPNVILGPSEDSGVVEIAKEPGKRGKRFGIVVSHESHNHPSQVVPYEGSATGIGGCVRDVLCMGAQVIANGDGLRFGELKRSETTYIANEVINGVAGYGNPIGVPNITGDTYFNKSFNDNCLVNVVSLGVLREDELIHSYAPDGAAQRGYEIIVVGKPTDMSGMGGAAFASLKLQESDKEKNKGAVQEPNPFLKRHIMQSTYELFKIFKDKGILERVGFKDMGAGGIMCATVEMVAKAGYGAEIDLQKINVAMPNLPPHVIACGETQERMCWIVPKDYTKLVLKHYNETWDLPSVAKGACATVIGRVTKGNYVLWYDGVKVCDAKASAITEGLSYNRPYKEKKVVLREPNLPMPRDMEKVMLEILSHENVACKVPVYESYDRNVQGMTVIEAGEADAGVVAPLRNRDDVDEKMKLIGVALKMDANPRYGQIDPYWQAANAVVEGVRNVSAVGAEAQCITDCLNYGNPEIPDQMYQFVRGVEGISDALRGIGLRLPEPPPVKVKKKDKGKKKLVVKQEKVPLPCISGNVSLYNTSDKQAIAPQAIIATIGKMEDVNRAITMQIKHSGNHLFLIGPRKNELGGSVYYDVMGELGANIPKPDFVTAGNESCLVADLISAGLVNSAHDISDGGLATAVAEMCMGGSGHGKIGAKIDISKIGERLPTKGKNKAPLISTLRTDIKLFSETGGFILEVGKKNMRQTILMARKAGIPLIKLGYTTAKNTFVVFENGKVVIDVKLKALSHAWLHGLRNKLSA